MIYQEPGLGNRYHALSPTAYQKEQEFRQDTQTNNFHEVRVTANELYQCVLCSPSHFIASFLEDVNKHKVKIR